MKISPKGLAIIKEFESCRLERYRDAGGLWTIGWGHLLRPGEDWPTITQEHADALLVEDCCTAEEAIEDLVRVPLTQNQFDSITSFCYNVGRGAFGQSTLLRKLNAQDYAAVPTELGKWVNAGGRRIEGLVRRRAAEAKLWQET